MPDGQQTGADAVTTIAVPPHPRLLSVLGDIEFQPWQCIAELVEAPRRPEGPRLPRGGPSEASDSAAWNQNARTPPDLYKRECR